MNPDDPAAGEAASQSAADAGLVALGGRLELVVPIAFYLR